MPYQIGTSQPTLEPVTGVVGFDPRATYAPGTDRPRTGSGTRLYRGYPIATWTFKAISIAVWDDLKTTYLGGEHSGETYIETRDDEGNYTQWRAVMTLPDSADLNRWGEVYRDVTIEFLLIEDVTPT